MPKRGALARSDRRESQTALCQAALCQRELTAGSCIKECTAAGKIPRMLLGKPRGGTRRHCPGIRMEMHEACRKSAAWGGVRGIAQHLGSTAANGGIFRVASIGAAVWPSKTPAAPSPRGRMPAAVSEHAQAASPRMTWSAAPSARSYTVVIEEPDAKPQAPTLIRNIAASELIGLYPQAKNPAP